MKKLLQFDFDGVIVNTLDMILEVKKELNQEISKADYIKLFHGNIFKKIEEKQNRAYTNEDQNTFFNLYGPRLLELKPTENIIDLIKRLSDKYELVIISSTINKPIEQFLIQHDIRNCFTEIYGADVHKSKIEKIKMSLDKNNFSPENSLYITDTLGDINEAKKAGVDSIAVSWGFHDIETLALGNPRYIANNISELEQFITDFSGG